MPQHARPLPVSPMPEMSILAPTRRAIRALRFVPALLAALAMATFPSPQSKAERPAKAPSASEIEKIALWRNQGGPRLRGAVIYQRRVYPEIDGQDLGPGPVGPPFKQDDFERLSRLGANVVVISHPGLFSEKPPYVLDRKVQANLDNLLQRIARADMFAVIALRTGPGRSEFTFYADEAGTWFGPDKLNDSIWGDAKAQDAWVAMWREVAARYRGNPTIVGYELMVEPNSNKVGKDARKDRPNIWDPAKFESRYGGTLYDWNRLYPRIVSAIRSVDPGTPILVDGNGYAGIDFLSQLKPVPDPRTVYVLHNYEPRKFTHQRPDAGISYPGPIDTDWDGQPEPVGADYLKTLFAPADAFRAATGKDLAATEIGSMRWAPGAAVYIEDETALLEARGIPYTAYQWAPIGPPYSAPVSSFTMRLGPSPENLRVEVDSSPFLDVLKKRWARNSLRPSNVRFPEIKP